MKDFSCEGPCSGSIICDASNQRSSPVFGLKYSSGVYTKLLAASDEDGYLSIINTNNKLPTTLSDDTSIHRPVAQWLAHSNAIFDLSWAKDDSWMYTCSGDTSIRLFDTAYATKISTFGGHTGSVKSIAVSPHSHSFFASGGRDGIIHLWDARVPTPPSAPDAHRPLNHTTSTTTTHVPVMSLKDGHAPRTKQHKRQKTLQGRLPPSVTALQFLSASSGHILCSGGIDGIVKFWDVRYTLEPTTLLPPTPLSDTATTLARTIDHANKHASLDLIASANQAQLGDRQYAVTSLALHPDGSRLLVSFIRGHHLLFDVSRPDAGPVKWFGGHMSSSFYVKSTFSPDGSHIASGSSDHGVYIWQADGAHDETDCVMPYVLQGHEKEVTTVAWCPQDFCQLASAGDDHVVKLWNVHRRQTEETRDIRKQWNQRRMDVMESLLNNNNNSAMESITATQSSKVPRSDDDLENDAAFAARILQNNSSSYTGSIHRNKQQHGDAAHELQRDEALLHAAGQSPCTPMHGAATAARTQGVATSHTVALTTTQSMRTGNRMKISNALRLHGQQAQLKAKRQQTLVETLFISRGRAIGSHASNRGDDDHRDDNSVAKDTELHRNGSGGSGLQQQ